MGKAVWKLHSVQQTRDTTLHLRYCLWADAKQWVISGWLWVRLFENCTVYSRRKTVDEFWVAMGKAFWKLHCVQQTQNNGWVLDSYGYGWTVGMIPCGSRQTDEDNRLVGRWLLLPPHACFQKGLYPKHLPPSSLWASHPIFLHFPPPLLTMIKLSPTQNKNKK